MKLLRKLIDSETAGAVSIAFVAFVAFAIMFLAATAGPVHAQGGDGTAGTLPYTGPVTLERTLPELSAGTTWTIAADGSVLVLDSPDGGSNSCAQAGATATAHTMSWRCKWTSHSLTITMQPGETPATFEERCANELGLAQRHFPPDNT